MSRFKYIFVLFQALFFGPNSFGGEFIPSDTLLILSEISNDRIVLLTDRYIYATGEKILFTAYHLNSWNQQDSSRSTVLYLELLSPQGKTQSSAKYPVSFSGSEGSLLIPENLLTGNYYLAAYTKWMRNFSPDQFHYREIKIINPFSDQLEPSSLAGSSDSLIRVNPESISSQDHTDSIHLENDLTCIIEKFRYKRRERVNLNIMIPAASPEPIQFLNIAVANPAAMDTSGYSIALPDSVNWSKDAQFFMPEINGLSISGRLNFAGSSYGPENTDVELSVLGQYPKFRVKTVNADGSFIMALGSMRDNHDIFIASKNNENLYPDILIDNEFANPNVRFLKKPHLLSATERKAASEIMFNMQIQHIFGNPHPRPELRTAIEATSLFGPPSISIFIDEYIDLPTLEEVFIELIPEIMPQTRKDTVNLIFRGNPMNQSIINQLPPLILIDQVPVSDLGQMLLLSPKKVRRIDVVNEIYMIGEKAYGGIINIFSRNGDMAGIDLPGNAYFFNFTGYQTGLAPEFPTYTEANDNEKIPDYRNTLFWASIHPEPGQTHELSFYTSDVPGDYLILIRGISARGRIIQEKCRFQILSE